MTGTYTYIQLSYLHPPQHTSTFSCFKLSSPTPTRVHRIYVNLGIESGDDWSIFSFSLYGPLRIRDNLGTIGTVFTAHVRNPKILIF